MTHKYFELFFTNLKQKKFGMKHEMKCGKYNVKLIQHHLLLLNEIF